jgi:hypothetical protein
LSLGPDLEVEDQEVHAWTSVIDELLSDGDTLISAMAGPARSPARPAS